tara:strand:+ start:1524 stop:1934 length:411 start_codon:yes stop_codon:yes gene_type:complete
MIYNGSIKSEKQLFGYLKENFMPDLERTTRPMSRYDCFSNKYNLDIELKCRRTHYDELLVEKIKYEALMKRCADFDTIPLYINSTPKGVYAFYLTQFEMHWQTKSLPITTEFGKKFHVPKEVSYFSISEGIDLTKL